MLCFVVAAAQSTSSFESENHEPIDRTDADAKARQSTRSLCASARDEKSKAKPLHDDVLF